MSSTIMAVLLNGVAQIEYDREKILPNDQIQYLDNMDAKMSQGIPFGDEIIDNPDIMRKSQFVSQQLYQAIRNDNGGQAAAYSSYLATRMPDLKQVKIIERDGVPDIELIFDEEYGKQVAVSIMPASKPH